MSLSDNCPMPPGRVLAGSRHWWFLGPGGVARLGAKHVTADGQLQPATERRLRELGLCTGAPPRSYLLTVLTSTDCNLGCGYCFQNTGQSPGRGNRPPRIAHARLTSETITSTLEFTARQMAASGLDQLAIMLFGGEPLLNPRGCVELLARAADYGLKSARMISNATLLTPRLARELSDLKLRSIQVTFDGDRDDHDRIRVRRSHGGSFDTIVRNLVRASAVAPIKWQLRVNVSHHNHGGIDALLDRLEAALCPSRCMIYFTRVGDAGIGYGNELLHNGELAASFTRWHRRAVDAGFAVSRPSAPSRCQTCGPGDARYGAVVSADGTLASCWETAGKSDWQVGTVSDGYLPAAQIGDRWTHCEDSYQFADGRKVIAAFRDQVDAALLDYLNETGHLRSGNGQGGVRRALA